MTKAQFLTKLASLLAKLPEQERDDILRDYEEYFAFAMEEGKSEQDVVQALGTPKQLAKELTAAYYMEEVEKNESFRGIFRAAWAGVGLGFMNITFMLGPYIALLGVLAAFWISAFGFVVTPVLFVAKILLTDAPFHLHELFTVMLLTGIGLLLGIALYYVTMALKKWTIRYLKFNIKIVKGELHHA